MSVSAVPGGNPLVTRSGGVSAPCSRSAVSRDTMNNPGAVMKGASPMSDAVTFTCAASAGSVTGSMPRMRRRSAPKRFSPSSTGDTSQPALRSTI